MSLPDNPRVAEVADLLADNNWTLTLRSVAGRRFRAVVVGEGGAEVASKVADDFASALLGALALALSPSPSSGVCS